jgi:hypothetical protein
MKLIALLYLEEDQALVEQILAEAGVGAWSGFDMEGHGSGVPGWYGDVASYRSRLLFTWGSTEQADRLMESVAAARGVQDPSHPIHALKVDVEAVARSGLPPVPPADA